MGAGRAGGGRERRGDGGRAGGGPPGPSALRAGGSWRRRSGAAGPGVGGGRTARGRPGKELAAAASPKPAPLPSPPLSPPALTSHLLPSLFLPPSVPGGKACSSPSPGARRRGPSRAAFPPRPGSGRPRGLPTRGRPDGVRLPLSVALGLSQLTRRGGRPPQRGGKTTKTGFPSLWSWSCWLVPERVCLHRPKMAFRYTFESFNGPLSINTGCALGRLEWSFPWWGGVCRVLFYFLRDEPGRRTGWLFRASGYNKPEKGLPEAGGTRW